MFNCCYSFMPVNVGTFGFFGFTPAPRPIPRPVPRPLFGFGFVPVYRPIIAPRPFLGGFFGGLLLSSMLCNRTTSSTPTTNTTATTTTPSTTTTTGVTTPAATTTTSKSTTNDKTVSKEKTEKLRTDIVSIANSYIGASEDNGGYKKFAQIMSDGNYSKEWCCDFASYVAKKAYEKQGTAIPTNFGNHDCRQMQQWAINNNKYYDVASLSGSDRAKAIAEKVHPGDLMLLLENDSSHIGVVTKVNSDGSFETTEGNRDDKVMAYKYSADDANLSGFVQLTA